MSERVKDLLDRAEFRISTSDPLTEVIEAVKTLAAEVDTLQREVERLVHHRHVVTSEGDMCVPSESGK